MTRFTVPLAWFEIHLAESAVRESAKRLQDAMIDLHRLMETGFADDSNDLRTQIQAMDRIADGSAFRRVEMASQEFKRSLEISEFPPELPKITHQLIYASIVAQAFRISFDVLHQELEVNDKGRGRWAVTWRVANGRGWRSECCGFSFMFDKDDERAAEGVLLSACADA